MKTMHYRHLLLMTALSFVAMFVLMYAMVDVFAHVFVNINQAYMAGLMAAPMILIELLVMRSMYHDRRKNIIFSVAAMVGIMTFWLLIRQQTLVSDEQFLRSMIPHHSGAILMCQQASISDADIRQLCQEIIASQNSEIHRMQAKLDALTR